MRSAPGGRGRPQLLGVRLRLAVGVLQDRVSLTVCRLQHPAGLGSGGALDKAIDKAGDVADQAEGWMPWLERLVEQPMFWVGLGLAGVCVYLLVRQFNKEDD